MVSAGLTTGNGPWAPLLYALGSSALAVAECNHRLGIDCK